MATKIKFDVDRMQEVDKQLDDIKTTLTSSMKAVQGNLTDLSNNIKGSGINKTLTNYQNHNENVLESIVKNIGELEVYLKGKIAAYKLAEETTAVAIKAIENIIDF